jgi:hypothetical protein
MLNRTAESTAARKANPRAETLRPDGTAPSLGFQNRAQTLAPIIQGFDGRSGGFHTDGDASAIPAILRLLFGNLHARHRQTGSLHLIEGAIPQILRTREHSAVLRHRLSLPVREGLLSACEGTSTLANSGVGEVECAYARATLACQVTSETQHRTQVSCQSTDIGPLEQLTSASTSPRHGASHPGARAVSFEGY